MDQPTPRRLFLQAGLAGIGLAATVSACSDDADDPPPTSGSSREPATPTATATSTASGSDAGSRSNVLLVYFSRAGENYFNGGRKTLKVGNTEVLANMIADRVTCDVYRIEAADPYPEAYERPSSGMCRKRAPTPGQGSPVPCRTWRITTRCWSQSYLEHPGPHDHVHLHRRG